jgi:hypothetical protein
VSYRLPRKNFWTIHLLRSPGGYDWTDVTELACGESRTRRRSAFFPITRWSPGRREWGTTRPGSDGARRRTSTGPGLESREYLGGPNFIVLPNGALLAAGRVSSGENRRRLFSA